MKALIVYASWFGHNRTIAKRIAAELERCGVRVTCAPISKITTEEAIGYDLLVLGTYSHTGHASRRLRALCEAIPLRRLGRMAVALFGTQSAKNQQRGLSGGVDELDACLGARGCELVTPPLRIGLPGKTSFAFWSKLGEPEQQLITEFATDLWEIVVPEPIIGAAAGTSSGGIYEPVAI